MLRCAATFNVGSPDAYERSAVCAEMALRLGTLLGNGAQLWLDMQTKFDLWQAEAKLHDELGQMKPLKKFARA